MKITEYSGIKGAGGVKKRSKTGGVGSFSDYLDIAGADGAGASAQLSDVSATAAIDNMLALQEISEDDVQRHKAFQQGKNLLDELEKLRHQLLMGTVPLHTLRSLGRQLSIQRSAIADPGLHALIDDIELRAAVELAKLEMASHPRDQE